MARFLVPAIHVLVVAVTMSIALPTWAQQAAPVIPLCGVPGAQTACSAANPLPVSGSLTPTEPGNIASVPLTQSTVVSNAVLKASAGGLIGFTATTGAVSGWVMVFDATSLPLNGAVTPKNVYYVPSNGTGGGVSVAFSAPEAFGTGITVGFSSTGPFTLTASATAAIAGQVQ